MHNRSSLAGSSSVNTVNSYGQLNSEHLLSLMTSHLTDHMTKNSQLIGCVVLSGLHIRHALLVAHNWNNSTDVGTSGITILCDDSVV